MSTAVTRSTFVTVLAWIFIGLSALGTLVGTLQVVMLFTLLADSPFNELSMTSPPEGIPAPAVFLMSHFKAFFGLILAVNAAALVVSIGLLRRKNWARLAFIGLMGLGILQSVLGLVFQIWMFNSMRDMFHAPGAPNMWPLLIIMGFMAAVFAAGFFWLYAWIIKRLMSKPVATEFGVL